MPKTELNLTNIVATMKEAMNKTLGNIYSFSSEPKDRIHAEYLFTVNVAQTISKLHMMRSGEPHPIRLEKSTNDLINECFPYIRIRQNGVFSRSTVTNRIVRGKSLIRKGRADIVCYKLSPPDSDIRYKKSSSPLCVIELKSFKPATTKIKEDLVRNAAFLDLYANIGENSLDFAVFASFENYVVEDNVVISDITAEEQVKQRYSKIIDDVLVKHPKIEEKIVTFTVQKSAGTIDRNLVFDGVGYQKINEIDTSTKHHYVGVIITFNRKEVSS